MPPLTNITPFTPGKLHPADDYDKVADKLESWLNTTTPQYLESPEYQALSKANKKGEGGWFGFFMDMVIGYFNGKLASVSVNDVQEIMEELTPRKMICSDNQAKTIVPELIAYWQFLLRECGNKKLKNAPAIIAYLEGIRKNYLSIYKREGAYAGPPMEILESLQGMDNPNFIPWVDELIEEHLNKSATAGVFPIGEDWGDVLSQPSNVAELVQHVCLNELELFGSHEVDALGDILGVGFQHLFMGVRNQEPDALEVLEIFEFNIPKIYGDGDLVPAGAKQVFRALAPHRSLLSKEFLSFIQNWQMEHLDLEASDPGVEEDEPPSPDQLRSIFNKLLDEVPHEFAAMQAIQNMLGIVPVEALALIFRELVALNDTRVGDVLSLYALDNDEQVACAALNALASHPACVGPVCLGRLVRMRNWFSGSVQKALDALVRDVRKRGVMPQAAHHKGEIVEVLMPPVDPIGSQGIMVVLKTNKIHSLVGCVIKEGMGIVDCLSTPPILLMELKRTKETMKRQLGRLEKVSLDLVRGLIPNYLAHQVQSGMPIEFELVHLLEIIGLEDWSPRTQNLESLLPPELLAVPDTAEIAAVQKRAQRWYTTAVGSSWFERSEELDSILDNTPSSQQVAAICDQILDDKRTIWQERMLHMALWSYYGVTKNGVNTRMRAMTRDFLVMRHLLSTAMPTQDIALMRSIANRSLSVREIEELTMPF